MAIKLGDAIVFLRGDSKPLDKDLDKAEKKTTIWTRAVGTTVGNLMSSAIAGGARLATSMVQGLGRELLNMTLDAAKVEGVSNTFGRLAESVGGDAAVAMEQLRGATRGMVADADLMQAGNKFLAMGLADTTEGVAKLSEMATQLGMAMGEDATSSMENFALMMANQSIPRLDSFGISSSKVRTRIKELMDATEGMTRETAFNTAVMEQAALTMEKVGEQAGTSAAKIAGMQATWANLKLVAGQALQPILDVFVSLGENIVEKWGPKIEEWLVRIKKPIELFADALSKLFSGRFNEFLGSLHDGLIALGVPEETVIKITNAISTFESAFQDLKDGNIEEFIGKVKAALVELGVPIEVVDGLEAAFRWLLDTWTKVETFWTDTLKPALIELWEEILGPALEGLLSLFKDFEPLLPIIGGLIALWIVAPFLAAAAPVIALGAALVALGLIWKEHGETVKEIVGGLRDLIDILLGIAGEKIGEVWENITSLKLPDWLTPGSPTPLENAIRGLADAAPEARKALQDFFTFGDEGVNFAALDKLPNELREKATMAHNAVKEGQIKLWEDFSFRILDPKPAEKAATAWGEAITSPIQEALDELKGTIIEDKINSIARAANGLFEPLRLVSEAITEMLASFLEFQKIDLPDWLTPGSTTPFELGLRGITDAMTELGRIGTPNLQMALAGAGTTNNYNFTASYQQTQNEGSLMDDVRALSIMTAGTA